MTPIPNTLTVSQARENLYDLVEEVTNHLRSFIITHHGQPTAVLVPVEELDSWQETFEIMSNKKLLRDIKQAEKEIKAGKTISRKKAERLLGVNED